MRKRRLLTFFLAALLLCGTAHGEGFTLRTVSSFAGADTAAEAYVDILKAYEAESGNMVLDASAVSDEAWKTSVLNEFTASNEPDILFFFGAGADSAPILYKVMPIAISLSDIPHYLAEFALLSCATAEEQQACPRTLADVPASWFDAMALIRELYLMGAFADNADATFEGASTELFRTKKAAMQIDGSWLASSLSDANMETTQVLPVPLRSGAGASGCCIGGISMGFYLTRRAWESPRRDTAVSLLSALTREDSLRRLGYTGLGGALLTSAKEMMNQRKMLSPLQDAMSKNAREVWLLECIPAVASGAMTPEACWERVMALHPFGE